MMLMQRQVVRIAILLAPLTCFTQTQSQTTRQLSDVPHIRPAQMITPDTTWGLLPVGNNPQNQLGVPYIKHLAQDQKMFWTSPFHLRTEDLKTVVPFLGFTGALVAGDSWMARQVPDSPGALKRSNDFSNYAMFSLVGIAGGSYIFGKVTNNDHLRETGLLTTEAAIDSSAAALVFKGITQRPRPLQNGGGRFSKGGGSFPSEHSSIAWSVASVLAHEYPGPLTKFLAYGLASGVTISRVTAKQHFASDAFVGSVLGWYMGRQVYRLHHDPEVGGTAWGSSAPIPAREGSHPFAVHSSSYVPLDSWVYPAMARLSAWGYLQTSMLGQRPWTRAECARLLEEADGQIPREEVPFNEAAIVFRALQDEFKEESGRSSSTLSFHLDDVYTRITQISGTPLTDGYNFGETIINDYGRPYQQGTNTYDGVSAHGNLGPFSFYFREEYQHAPSAPGESAPVRQAVADALSVPAAPGTAFAEVNRARLVEGYVSVATKGLQLTFGKQALWWGPTETGPLLESTNAEPITMLRLSTVEPFKLPSILSFLGPVRTEFFLGQLQGQQYILDQSGIVGPVPFKPQPFIDGQKISFKPTPNLEFGFSRTVIFAGLGHPFTFNSFFKSIFNVSSSNQLQIGTDAGDRRSGFDFNYRLPHLRKWVSLYTDSFCDDDISPLAAPRRCAWSPGIYLAKFPRLEKLDFRAEGIFTDSPGFTSPGTNYQNIVYRSGYTNYGNIIGSWIGRDGIGLQLSSTYWLSSQSKIQAGFRHQEVDQAFLQGGNLSDFSLRGDFALRNNVFLSSTAQYENWNFPLLAPRSQTNFTVSFALTFRPKWGITR